MSDGITESYKSEPVPKELEHQIIVLDSSKPGLEALSVYTGFSNASEVAGFLKYPLPASRVQAVKMAGIVVDTHSELLSTGVGQDVCCGTPVSIEIVYTYTRHGMQSVSRVYGVQLIDGPHGTTLPQLFGVFNTEDEGRVWYAASIKYGGRKGPLLGFITLPENKTLKEEIFSHRTKWAAFTSQGGTSNMFQTAVRPNLISKFQLTSVTPPTEVSIPHGGKIR